MTINSQDVNYIAKLAKLKFSEEEAQKLAHQFDDILKHFENLNNEELTLNEITNNLEVFSLLRKDEVTIASSDKKELFQNVKAMKENYIQIPKVIE